MWNIYHTFGRYFLYYTRHLTLNKIFFQLKMFLMYKHLYIICTYDVEYTVGLIT